MEKNPVTGKKRSEYGREMLILAGLCVATFILSSRYDLLEAIVDFSRGHERWQLDELLTVALVLVLALAYYSVKRWRDLAEANHAMEKKNEELRKAFGEIRQLRGILPICSCCKRIRDDAGYWHQVEVYVRDHTGAEFSHSICPECMQKLYPDFVQKSAAET